MISRIILLCTLIGVSASNLAVTAEQAKPLTPTQLQAKAKHKSISNACNSKRKTKSIKNLCRRVKKQLTYN